VTLSYGRPLNTNQKKQSVRNVLFILLSFICSSSCHKDNLKHTQAMPLPFTSFDSTTGPYSKINFTYLALGDSYTIGQGVPVPENYPSQVIARLEKENLHGQLKIIATSGWTTDQLVTGIADATTDGSLQNSYDIVSLLIGVNNQYKGESVADYKRGFEDLLKKAIQLSGNSASRVIVLSIPDWGVTPFASGLNRIMIGEEIDAYNAINKQVTEDYGAYYIDITPVTREVTDDSSLLAGDGLHYSGKEYALWAQNIAGVIKTILHR
jgi:lysophospholipase L1-like esterase